MKKIFYLLPIFCFFALTLTGCSGADINTYIKSNVSENCSCYFVGETNNFYVNLFSGKREQPYKLDGVANKMVDYTIVSVQKRGDVSFNELQYCIEIDDKTYEGAFSPNPYDNTLDTDLEIAVSADSKIFVYIKLADNTEVASLNNVSNNFLINSTTALDIAVDEVIAAKPEIDKSLTYECFIQVLNKDDNAHLYFWIVNIVSSSGDMYNIIIDTTTGQVLAKKL